MKNNNLFFLLSILIVMMSCKKENDIAKIEFNKYVNFGTIKVGDTINEVFVIKNISSNILKINEIKTSCGCTIAKINDSIVNSKSSTNINVTFIAEKGDVGIIEKSIVLDTNTKPNFNVIYLKGKVIN